MAESVATVNPRKAASWAVGTVWVVLFVLGAWGFVERITEGHHRAAYGSYVTWGLWVSGYIYFIGLSAGAFLISSLVYVFRVQAIERIGRLALFTAVVTLFMALLCIWVDLGHMERFYYVFLHPNFRSMMAWMVWLYTAYFLLLLAELWFALRPELAGWAQAHGWRGILGRVAAGSGSASPEALADHSARTLRVLGAIGVPLAISFHGGVGALFATVVARPYWHSSLYPILFLTGALLSGGALLTAVVAFVWPDRGPERDRMVAFLGRIVLGLLLFDLMLEWAEFSIHMWYGVGHTFELLERVLFGEFWYVFWVFHILLGALVPIGLLVTRWNDRRAVGLASLLVAATYLSVRLNLVIPGLVEPQLRGLERAYHDHRLLFSYVPSWFEWQVLLFVVALGAALFYLGYRLLPLVPRRASAPQG